MIDRILSHIASDLDSMCSTTIDDDESSTTDMGTINDHHHYDEEEYTTTSNSSSNYYDINHLERRLPGLEELVSLMSTARSIVDLYLMQSMGFKRMTPQDHLYQWQQIKSTMVQAKALGIFTINLGRVKREDGGYNTRMRLPHHDDKEEVEVLNAGSLSYLGLDKDPEVIQAVKEALDEYGTSVTNSRAVCGRCPLHVQVSRMTSL